MTADLTVNISTATKVDIAMSDLNVEAWDSCYICAHDLPAGPQHQQDILELLKRMLAFNQAAAASEPSDMCCATCDISYCLWS